MTIRDITRIAFMTALLCVCSWVTVPFTVPFTLQTFAVFCAFLLLGWRNGLLSVVLYLLLGAAGLPVFSGFQGGVGHIVGPTGGYLIGFLFFGLVFLLMEPLIRRNRKFVIPALLIGLVICYLFGSLWFSVVYISRGQAMGFWKILTVCVIPFIIPDLAKMALAVYVCSRVRRFIPLNP